MSVDRSTKGLAQNTAFVLVAELVVQATRAATIFVLADVFDKEEFGRYVGLLGLMTLLGPVSQWGMNHVGVRAVAHELPFARTWAKVTTSTWIGGLLGTGIATVISLLIFDVDAWTVVAFGIAQLVGFNTAQAATMMAEAYHRSDVGLRINITGGIVRLALLGAFVTAGFSDLGTWSLFLLVGMLSWGILSAVQVARAFGGEHRLVPPSNEDLRLGIGFVFVQTSSSGQTDIDKIVLNAYGLANDAAVYSPGYRIAELSTVPLIALVRATYAEFFRRGSSTVREAMAFARRLTAIAAGYGIVAGAALFLFAPLVLLILDDTKYAESVDVIRWLAFIPLAKGLQYFPGNALTGADHHNVRTWIIFTTAIVNLLGNLIFIPTHGWKAAAITTLVAEMLFAALLWAAVTILVRREGRAGTS
jgi:O-antigen/teichoic acid export membrane protein